MKTGTNTSGGEIKEVVISGFDSDGINGNKDYRAGVDQRDLLDDWNDVNNINDRIVSPVTVIFETGAIVSNKGVNTALDVSSNLKVLKVAGNISRVANGLGVGYAAVIAYNDPSNSNKARLGAQIAIIGIEAVVNIAFPGLGIVVGFGLSAIESKYGQGWYDSIDKN